MGTVQKVLWWIFWYAIVWFGFACLIAGVSEMELPMLIKAILFFALFIFPGWYATRKVKQKALKKEMEQRTRNFAPQSKPASQPLPPVSDLSPQITPQPIAKTISFETGRNQQAQSSATAVEPELPSLNAATVEDLTKLSAINRILAMQIISQKEKGGDYLSFEDLFARVQLSSQAQEELRRNFSIVSAGNGRFIDF